MAITLHLFPSSPRAFKVLLVAHHLQLDYTFKMVNLGAGDQRSPSHTQLNANQRMPVLEDDGYVLWESNAIIEYLAAQKPEVNLIPADLRARLQVAKWLYWESAHWDQACAVYVFERVVKPLFGMGPEVATEIERGNRLMGRLAKVLDGELQKRRYIAGDTLTLADFAMASPFCYSQEAAFPLAEHAAIARWIGEMKSLPAWSAASTLQRPPA